MAMKKVDFTIKNPNKAVIRFNPSQVLKIVLDMEQMTLLGEVEDEIDNKVYSLTGELVEKE